MERSRVCFAEIAQLVEHVHGKHKVTGSIPVLGSMGMHQKFYVGVKAFIEIEGKLLVLFTPSKLIDFPGGRIEQEDEMEVERTLRREVLEEVGLKLVSFEAFTTWTKIIAHGAEKGEPLFLVGYRCTVEPSEIVLSAEHISYKLVNNNSSEIEALTEDIEYQGLIKSFFV